MSYIAKTIVSASPDEKTSPDLRTCRQCGCVSVPRKAAGVKICIHCGSTYGATGTNAARYPKQGTDVVPVNGNAFTL